MMTTKQGIPVPQNNLIRNVIIVALAREVNLRRLKWIHCQPEYFAPDPQICHVCNA